jgi:hypothetical protein
MSSPNQTQHVQEGIVQTIVQNIEKNTKKNTKKDTEQKIETNTNTEIIEKKIPKTLPAKYLKHMAFLKWFQDNGSTIPQYDNIPDTISFLNQFIDFESTHINNYKLFIKNNSLLLKQQNKDKLKQDKQILKLQKTQWNSLKKLLKTDHNLRSYFINNHLNLIHTLLNNPPSTTPSTTLHNLLKTNFPKFNLFPHLTHDTLHCFNQFLNTNNEDSINDNNSKLTETKITTLKGEKLLIDDNNNLYDIKTQKLISNFEEEKDLTIRV